MTSSPRLRSQVLLRRSRRAVTAVFAVNGAVIASLSVRTPSLQATHDLSTGALGMTSVTFGVAAVATMQVVGGLARRYGSSGVLRPAVVLLPLGLLGVGLAQGTVALFAAFVVLGVIHGAVDVTMNAHAVAVERALGRPILQGCHAAWSLGAVAGSVAGGLAAGAGWDLAEHWGALAPLLVLAGATAALGLLPPQADRGASRRADGVRPPRATASWRVGWSRTVVLLGIMGAVVLMGEGAAASWSGLLLRDHAAAGLGVAALGYVAFSVCETGCRLVGDRLLAAVPARVLVRTGCAVAAAGFAVAIVAGRPAIVIAGFAVVGVGLAAPLPVLFRVVGNLGVERGQGAASAVSRFTTMTYSGILLAPAVVGWAANAVGVAKALAALVPLLLGVTVLAGRAVPAATEAGSAGVAAPPDAVARRAQVSRPQEQLP